MSRGKERELSPAARLGAGGSDCRQLFVWPLRASERGAGPGGSAARAAVTPAVLSRR